MCERGGEGGRNGHAPVLNKINNTTNDLYILCTFGSTKNKNKQTTTTTKLGEWHIYLFSPVAFAVYLETAYDGVQMIYNKLYCCLYTTVYDKVQQCIYKHYHKVFKLDITEFKGQ